jgi:hypothetical protein
LLTVHVETPARSATSCIEIRDRALAIVGK